MGAIDKERRTFSKRLVPGETILRERGADFWLDSDPLYQAHGPKFNWRPNHFLSRAKKYAEEIIATPKWRKTMTCHFCHRFLSDLGNGATRGILMDPCAAENISLWWHAFGTPDLTYSEFDVFTLANLLGWKTASGAHRLCDHWHEVALKHASVLAAGFAQLQHKGE